MSLYYLAIQFLDLPLFLQILKYPLELVVKHLRSIVHQAIVHEQWLDARLTEGASQRVQEDTLKFARIMEGLGTGLLDSIMTLIAFTPILWGLSLQIEVLPWIG